MINNEVNPLSSNPSVKAHVHHHHEGPKEFVAAVEHASEERGLRLTPLRKEVLELVAAAGKPVKAYDLLDHLRAPRQRCAAHGLSRARFSARAWFYP
jgi:Fur family zinc uptake transcriptional regulator